MSSVYKAIADPTRRKILQMLRQQDMTAGEIAKNFSLAQPTISRHLNVLKSADLIQGDKNGTTITYHLNLSVLEEAMAAILEMFSIEPGGDTDEQTI